MSGTIESHKKPKFVNKTISYKRIEWLRSLLDLPREVGGSLDFNKRGKLDRFTVYTGAEEHVILPDAFQIEWHTHPRGGYVELPSTRDLKAAMNRRLKVGDFRGELSLVVSKSGICVYSYRKNIPGLKKKDFDKIRDILQRGRDTVTGIEAQMIQIRPFGFDIEMQRWETIRSKGLKLRFCMKEYLTDH